MKKIGLILGLMMLVLSVLGAEEAAQRPGPASNQTKVVFLLFDGTRADTIERLVEEGKMPHFQQLKSQGLWVDNAISVFPSTTGPAYAPFLTGLYPCNSGLTGIRQYLRKSGTYRVYCGTDLLAIKKDMNPDYKTIFELLPPKDSLSILGMVDRGSKNSPSLPTFAIDSIKGKPLDFDRHIAQKFRDMTKKGLPRFSFVSLHAADGIGHKKSSDSPEYAEALVNFDQLLGDLISDIRKKGELNNLILVICADHGHQPTTQHGNIADWLQKRLQIKVKDSIPRSSIGFNLRKAHNAKEYDAILAVSGNACVQIYLKGFDSSDQSGTAEKSFQIRPALAQMRRFSGKNAIPGDVIATVLEEPCVGFLCVRDGIGRYRIFSRNGESLIIRLGENLSYQVVRGNDPLVLGKKAQAYMNGSFIPERKWLKITAQDPYPDSVFQISQLLEAENSGDIIVNAAPGYEPWNEGQQGVHGGLDRAQMRVPLLIWGKGIQPGRRAFCRTVDLFPTMLKWLNVPVPSGVPGLSLF